MRRTALFLGGSAAVLLIAGTAVAQTAPASPSARQMRVLQEQIRSLQRQLDDLKQGQAATARAADEAKTAADQTRAKLGDQPLVTTSSDTSSPKVAVTLQGLVNREVNLAADGHKGKAFFADSDFNPSRIRLEGKGEVNPDVTVAAHIEVAFGPNNSEEVSQIDEDPGTFTDERYVEAYVDSKRLGRLWLGKGSNSADGTAESDASLVGGPVMGASVGDPSGGLLFQKGGNYTGTSVDDAYNDFDGARDNRIRYDTPVFGGVQFSGSAAANQKWDLAVGYGTNFGDNDGVTIGDFTTLAQAAIYNPNDHGTSFITDGSVSVMHDPSGVSLTLSSGLQDQKGDDPWDVYGKLGWDAHFFGIGPTGFGVDYSYGKNISGSGDKSWSVGGAVVQRILGYGLDVYGQLRYYSVDFADASDPNGITALTLGTQIRF